MIRSSISCILGALFPWRSREDALERLAENTLRELRAATAREAQRVELIQLLADREATLKGARGRIAELEAALAHNRTGWDVALEVCAQHVEARKVMRADLANLLASRDAETRRANVAHETRDTWRKRHDAVLIEVGAEVDAATARAEKAEAELKVATARADEWKNGYEQALFGKRSESAAAEDRIPAPQGMVYRCSSRGGCEGSGEPAEPRRCPVCGGPSVLVPEG